MIKSERSDFRIFDIKFELVEHLCYVIIPKSMLATGSKSCEILVYYSHTLLPFCMCIFQPHDVIFQLRNSGIQTGDVLSIESGLTT